MRKLKKFIVASTLAVSLLAATGTNADAAAKVKLSSKKMTLKEGDSKTLTLKKGKKKVKSVKWKSSNKKVATVKKGKVKAIKVGKATITATANKKKYTCKVTVTKSEDTTITASTTESKTEQPATRSPEVVVSTTEKATEARKTEEKKTEQVTSEEGKTEQVATEEGKTEESSTESKKTEESSTEEKKTEESTTEQITSEEETTENFTEDAEADEDFFKNHVDIEYGFVDKYVEFDVKRNGNSEEDSLEIANLKELGYEISEDGSKAFKIQKCESVKYTFDKLPTNLEQIKSFFAEEELKTTDENGTTWEYGGFNAMAATICAANTFKGGSNPSDPLFSKDPVRDMFEYINGPSSKMNISETNMTTAINSMKEAISSRGGNVYKAYFNGASPKNNYTPNEPYVLEMYKGPYFIEEKETITGKRPTTYMILVGSEGFDSERYIDVYYSTKDQRWYSYDDSFLHVTANNFKELEEEW